MSSISSLSGGIAQFIQNLNPSGAASPTFNASSGAATAATPRHHHAGGAFAKLADAVENALQSASNGSGGSTDANQTITDALTRIFQNGSLDASADPTSDTATKTTAATTAAATLPADFLQTLKSFGVTPEQFKADLSTALKTAQETGTVDPTALFKNFPTGSIVDTVG